jgi:cyanate permease
MLDQTDRQVLHARRLAWAKVGLTGFGIACGFASVLLFIWLAKYYIDHGAPTQGAAIIGALAAVVAAFVGSKAISEKRDTKK